MADYVREKRKAGLLPMYERQASEYYNKNEKSGLHEDIKDGYISSTSKMDGMGEHVDTLENEDGGFYGEGKGEKTYIYKKPKEKQAPAAAAAAPKPEAPAAEPEKDKGPVEYSPEVAQAKERVNNYQSMINGNEGSTFSTDTSAPAEASAAGTTGVSFEPAKIDTPAYSPNAGEEKAQSFADKYKLGIINSGSAGQSDFSAV